MEEMDLKWQLALLSMRARRSRRNQESRPRNQDSSRKTVIVEDTSSKAMVAIDGAGFDWSYMADDEVPTNKALMAFSDSEKNFAPTEVLTKSGIVPISNARQSSSRAAAPVSAARPRIKESMLLSPQHAGFRDLKLKSKIMSPKTVDHTFVKRFDYADPEGRLKHMTGNISYLTNFKEHDGGYVAFGGGAKGGKIIGKGTIRTGGRPEWLFDLDALSKSMNYAPVSAGTNSNDFAGKEASFDVASKSDNQERPNAKSSTKTVNTAGPVNNADYPNDPLMPDLEDAGIFNDAYDDRDKGVEADYNNLETIISVSSIPSTRLHKDHPKEHIIGEGHRQEKGIDYDKVFALVARIEAIRLFLAYALFMDFTVYQMDMKSAFLYGIIKEEVYVSQPLGFVDPEFPDRMYKVEQRKEGIFLSHEKYAGDILKKFSFSSVKSASTPMETHKPLSTDVAGTDVDVHLYRSMIGLLMYLTSSRTDIMFVVCACSRFQVQPKVSHMHAVKRIFRYLKGQTTLGLWYPKDSPLELIAYSDSDYAGASLDRKSTTEGYQFLGSRLISWQYNESAICVVKNLVYHSKTNHIKIRHHFNRDSYEKRLIEMVKIHTNYNAADLLTKAFDVTSMLVIILILLVFSFLDFINTTNGHQFTMSNRQEMIGYSRANDNCAKTTSWNEFSCTMASAIICLATNKQFNFSRYILLSLVKNIEAGVPFFMFPRFVQLIINHQLGDMTHHKAIFATPSLTKKVFANMKRVGIGFSGEVTLLFDNMLVQALEEVGILQAGAQTIPIPTEPSTSKPQKKHKPKRKHTQEPEVPPTESQAKHNKPLPSPFHDILPSGEDSLKLKELMDLCTNLSNKVLDLESEVLNIKSTYKAKIEKLESKVERLEEENRVLKELKGIHSTVDSDEPVMKKEESSKQRRKIANIDADVEINLEKVQAEAYNLDLDHQEKVFSMLDVNDEEPADVKEVLEVVKVAKLITKVVTTVGVDVNAASNKGKAILIEEPKQLKRQVQIKLDEKVARQLEAELNANINWNVVIEQVKKSERLTDAVMKYQDLKRKPLTKAQARRNMIVYLKNMTGYKMDYFKGMSYDKIIPLFEKHYTTINLFKL
nr:hypothetical protein [Tanacetum cinerariifolium]